MSGKIGEIGEKKDDDKWAQVREQREKFAAQNNSKAGESAGANAAAAVTETKGAEAAGAIQGSQAVQTKNDVAGISPEALAETKKTDTGNSTQEARVNFGAWGMSGSEAKAGETGNDVSKAQGVSDGQTVGKSKDTTTNNNPKRAAGEAGAAEAASQVGAAANTVQGAGGIQVTEASGAATANKPQTVPGVGETQASKKGLPSQ